MNDEEFCTMIIELIDSHVAFYNIEEREEMCEKLLNQIDIKCAEYIWKLKNK